MPELRLVAPVRTRYVRIYPERATAEGLGLRLELTGCDLDGEFLKQLGLLLWCRSVCVCHVISVAAPVPLRRFFLICDLNRSHQQNKLFWSVFLQERSLIQALHVPTKTERDLLLLLRNKIYLLIHVFFFCQQKLANTFPHKV